jgi:two-component system, response regulator PdtaR
MSDIIKFPSIAMVDSAPASAARALVYRRRASQLGHMADVQIDEAKMLHLIEQALSWIRLAENEEFLANVDTRVVVLIVEDDHVQRMESAETIAEAGFEVLEAENADAALAMLEAHPEISVVLTDVRMPGSMDGIKLAAAINRRWPPIKVVATSGVLGPDEVKMPDGGLFIPKSSGSDRIIGTLRELTRA